MFILIIWIPSGITLFTMLTLWYSTPDHASTRTPYSPCSGSSFGPPVQVDDLLSPLRLWLYMFGSGSNSPCWAVSRMDSLLFLFKLWHPTLGFPLYKHLSHPAYALICHVGLSLNMFAPLTLLDRYSNPLWLFPLLQSPLWGTYLALLHIMAWGLNHVEREWKGGTKGKRKWCGSIVIPLNLSYSKGYDMVVIMFLICISLMTNDVELLLSAYWAFVHLLSSVSVKFLPIYKVFFLCLIDL